MRERFEAHLAQSRFAEALWGVKVVSLDTGKTLFDYNAHKLFSPASNSKLYTVALALERLGPDYRIKTSLYAVARPDASGVLSGDLIVFGRGDPSLNARTHGGDILKVFDPLISALTNAGVKRIAGDLVADASFFRGPPFGSGWAWDDMEAEYGAEISALTINDNVLRLTVRPAEQVGAPAQIAVACSVPFLTLSNRMETVPASGQRRLNLYRPVEQNVLYATGQMPLGHTGQTQLVTVHNPPALFAALLAQALARHGINLAGQPRTVDWLGQVVPLASERLVELGAIESPPLRQIAAETLKPSQNLYADLLLAHVGESVRSNEPPGERTSEELGIGQLDKFVAEAGIPSGDVWFEEGSGLSRNNLTTPEATTALLAYMGHHKCAQIFLDALPIAGVDGTLRNRMKGTLAAGNVRAKTGTLQWAHCLSGYVTTAAGERLVFSFMLNRYHPVSPDHTARAELDALAVLLASFGGRSSEQ